MPAREFHRLHAASHYVLPARRRARMPQPERGRLTVSDQNAQLHPIRPFQRGNRHAETTAQLRRQPRLRLFHAQLGLGRKKTPPRRGVSFAAADQDLAGVSQPPPSALYRPTTALSWSSLALTRPSSA